MTNEQTIDEIMACADWYRAIDYVKWPESRGKLRNMIAAALAAKDAEIDALKQRLADSGRDMQALKAVPAPGEWVEWRGGECPIADGVRHRIRARGGFESGADQRATSWIGWRHGGGHLSEIVAYMVLE